MTEDPEQWPETFLRLMSDPGAAVLFNLNGIDVWPGVSRAAAGRGGPTDWELLQIRQNPGWWARIEWFKNDQPVVNPFNEEAGVLYHSTRRFQLWDYRVSHQQLLLRSPASPEERTNIDLVFWGVAFLALPTTLNGLVLERNAPENGPVTPEPYSAFEVVSEGQRHRVEAVGFKVLENELDIFDSSLVSSWSSPSRKDLGQTLVHS